MDKYQMSLERLKEKLDKEPKMNELEWNNYAMQNNLFSSFTMQAHRNVYNWEQLKKSLNERDKNLDRKIERTRKKLQNAVNKYGLSSKEAILINKEMNELITLYHKYEACKNIKKERLYSKR